MKKCFLVFIGAGMAIGAAAQVKQHVSFGPTIGYGHSWLNTSSELAPGYETKYHSTYNAGLKMVYSIKTHWGVSADVKYSSEGGSFENNATDNEVMYRANYIRVPVQGIYFFGDYGAKVHPKISIGPSFGFLVGGDTEERSNNQKVSEGKTKDMFKSFDFGVTGAVGLNVRLTKATWLNTDIAYYHGITNANDLTSYKMRNRNLGINVGVAFGVGSGKK
jgi:outer membrane protein W